MTLTNADLRSDRADGSSGGEGQTGPRAGLAQRRIFTKAYKLRIVEEYDGLTEHGARGALLRREGLYQSHIEKWRRARDKGDLAAGTGTVVQRGGDGRAVLSENRRLKQENERLKVELDQTRAVLDIVGKAQRLLETISGGTEMATLGTR